MQLARALLDRPWRVVRRVALHYRGGGDPAHDRPPHVRAASALCRWRDGLAVVSDDASFVATVDVDGGVCDPIALPAGPGGRRQFDRGRGNKADKLDLEACVELDGALVALGSDSGLAVRRQAAIVDDAGPRLVALPALYAALATPVLGAGVVNLEGATIDGDTLVLGNRGGDRSGGGAPTVDAIARLPLDELRLALRAPEAPRAPVVWQPLALGSLDGAPLHLTELEAWPGGVALAATAEATTTAYDDGVVTGSALGGLDADGAWWSPVLDHHGAALVAKLEGLAWWRGRWFATVDADDPDRPSDLLELTPPG